MNRAAVALLLSLAVLPVVTGCGKDSPAQPVARAPRDLSPSGVVRAFEFAINNRNTALLDSLFTEDFRFYFAAGDSAGLAEPLWLQPDESATNYAMLHGTPSVPPLSRITLDFDRNLFVFPDTRLGFDPKFHKTIRTSVNLKAEPGDGSTFEITGFLLFYVVRGDSAQILPGHGAPDSTRWWIQRLDDETIPPSGFRAMPTKNQTYGALKQLYRSYLRLPS